MNCRTHWPIIFSIGFVMLGGCANHDGRSSEKPKPKTTEKSYLPDSVSVRTSNVFVYGCTNEIINYPVYLLDTDAWIAMADTTVHLTRVRSGSGAKFLSSNEEYLYWSKGTEALLEIDNRLLKDCRLLPEEQSWEAAKLRGVDFRALGQEPGWYLEITGGKQIKYVGNYGQDTVIISVTDPVIDAQKNKKFYQTESGKHALSITVRDTLCADSMSGFEFPNAVTITVDGKSYSGCGRSLR